MISCRLVYCVLTLGRDGRFCSKGITYVSVEPGHWDSVLIGASWVLVACLPSPLHQFQAEEYCHGIFSEKARAMFPLIQATVVVTKKLLFI
jgi:hypothetical protein